MDEKLITQILEDFPGSKRAAEGVLLKIDDGVIFHLQNLIPPEERDGLTPDEVFYLAFCSKKEILRLRNLRSSHDYLLRVRAQSIVDAPRMVRVMRARRRSYEATGRPWALTHYYHSMDFHHKRLLDSLKRSDAKILKSIPSGLVPINDANAACIASLTGEIVVVSENLRHFYYFMTIALMGAPMGIDMADRINALLIAFRTMKGSESPDFDLDPRGVLPRDLEKKILLMVDDQMQFTFAHEYAHYLLGHVRSGEVLMSGEREKARTYSHECEFSADTHALQLVRHDSDATKRIAAGGISVFVFLSLLHRIRQDHGDLTSPVSDTHPAPENRMEHFLASISGRLSRIRSEADRLISECELLATLFPRFLSSSARADIVDFYGSVYLPTYRRKELRDRMDY
jgi:hypothetical protein